MCTSHGHPVFYSINLYVIIKSRDIVNTVNIPPRSLILVQEEKHN